jgi:hypothetical protein
VAVDVAATPLARLERLRLARFDWISEGLLPASALSDRIAPEDPDSGTCQ